MEDGPECVGACLPPLKESAGRCVTGCGAKEYLVASTRKCEGQCPGATVREAGRRVCYEDCERTLSGWEYLVAEERLCYQSCTASGTHGFRLPDEKECMRSCPTETQYHLDGVCFARCPLGSYRRAGRYRCETAPAPSPAKHAVSIAGGTYGYYLARQRSYSALDLSVEGTATTAAFLEIGGTVARLRLRATAEGDAGYAPAVFFRAAVMLASELQLNAKKAEGSALLGIKVFSASRLVGCHLLSSFEDTRYYVLSLLPSDLRPTIAGCFVDVAGMADGWYLEEGSGNVVVACDNGKLV